MLSWLGDVGGIADALYLFGHFLMMPYTAYSMQSNLLSRMFRLLPKDVHPDRELQQTDSHLSTSLYARM